MSLYWTPAGAEVSVAAAASATFAVNPEGLARVVNLTTSIALVALASANATAGEYNFSTIPGNGVLFIAYGAAQLKVAASVNGVRIQPGYARV